MLHIIMHTNHLRGRLPNALLQLLSLQNLDVGVNQLSGSILDLPDMSDMMHFSVLGNIAMSGSIPESVRYWTSLQSFGVGRTSLSGSLPDGIEAWSQLIQLSAFSCGLAGSIPDGIGGMRVIGMFGVPGNSFSGWLPDALGALSSIEGFLFADNHISGSIPEAMSVMTMVVTLALQFNWMTGTIPGAAGNSQMRLRRLAVFANQLTGTLPPIICCLKMLRSFDVHANQLSGSILTCFSGLARCIAVFAHENRFTGSIPTGAVPQEVVAYEASENMFEGTLPHVPLSLQFLGLAPSSLGSQLHGLIPSSLGRASKLDALIAQRHRIRGCVTACASLVALVVHGNMIQSLAHIRFKNQSSILLQHNALSCRLPDLGDVRPTLSLCAVGNHFQHPDTDFPDWVSTFEQDGLFWSTGREGLMVCFRALSSGMVFLLAVGLRLGWQRIARAVSRWHSRPGSQSLLRLCTVLLSCTSRRVVACIALLTALLDWDFYQCPRTLTLASACHIDSTHMHFAVVLLWGQLHWQFMPNRWVMCVHQRRPAALVQKQAGVSSVTWLVILLPLSSMAVLNVISKCVPGFLHIQGKWLNATNLLVGAAQGLISSTVIPHLAKRIAPDPYYFTSLANLLVSVGLPTLCIVYLDHECLGHWPELWSPCSRHNQEQFAKVGQTEGTLEETYKIIGLPGFKWRILSPDEFCSARFGHSCSRCVTATLLNLHPMLLAKVITGAFCVPTIFILRDMPKIDSLEVVVKLGLSLQLVMFFSGMLPLLMPILFLGFVSEMLMAAAAEEQLVPADAVVDVLFAKVASLGLIFSGWLHMVFTSGGALACVLQFVLALGLPVLRKRASLDEEVTASS